MNKETFTQQRIEETYCERMAKKWQSSNTHKNPTNVFIADKHNELKTNLKRHQNEFITYEWLHINESERMWKEYQQMTTMRGGGRRGWNISGEKTLKLPFTAPISPLSYNKQIEKKSRFFLYKTLIAPLCIKSFKCFLMQEGSRFEDTVCWPLSFENTSHGGSILPVIERTANEIRWEKDTTNSGKLSLHSCAVLFKNIPGNSGPLYKDRVPL